MNATKMVKTTDCMVELKVEINAGITVLGISNQSDALIQ